MIEDADDLAERLDARSVRAIQVDLVRALRSALDDAHAARRDATGAVLARLLAREADELARLNQTALPLPQGELVPVTALELLHGGRARAYPPRPTSETLPAAQLLERLERGRGGYAGR